MENNDINQTLSDMYSYGDIEDWVYDKFMDIEINLL